ncbi:MAG: APC family permease [Clostridiales bacterium]
MIENNNTESIKPQVKKAKMSTLSLFFMVFCLVAGGYFGLEDMVSSCGPGLAMLLILIFPFIWAIPQALYACELGSAIPDEGGIYVWVKRAFGEFWGYQVGWWRTIACYIDSAVYIVLAVAYINTFIDMSGWQSYVLKAGIILLFTYINYRGIEEVGKITTALILFVFATLAVFVVLGIANWNFNPFVPFLPQGQTLIQSLGLGIAIGVWCFCGYESIGTMAGEIDNPKGITKATLLTIPVVVLVYLLPIIFGLASYGNYADWAAEGGVSFVTIAASYGIPGIGLFFVLGAVATNLSVYNSYMASASRGFFVLSEDNLAPKLFCKINKKRGTPLNAILSMTVVNLVLVLFDFTTLVVVEVLIFMFYYLLWFLAGIALRIKEPNLERPFKIPGGLGFLIFITIAPILLCFITFFTNGASYLFIGCLGLLSGPVSYFIFKKLYGGINRVKKLSTSDKKGTVIIAVFVIFCMIISYFMYTNQSNKAGEYLNDVTPTLSQHYNVSEKSYNLSEDAFYSTLTDNANDDFNASIWFYKGSSWGDVYIGGNYKNESAFADAAFKQYEQMTANNKLLMDSITIYNDKYTFYAEYGEAYNSIEEVAAETYEVSKY